ncbi:hypothetical protein C8R43DRAFT_1243204 [Mycena crocata]|nr:hypothetical protein C8R43DRAFT_1243204 [Mycena crocata]
MRPATLAFIAASMLFAVNAAPLGERRSVVSSTDETMRGGAESTAPPWRKAGPGPAPASLFAERITQPTPPPWHWTLAESDSKSRAPTHVGSRSSSAESTPAADAPGWKMRTQPMATPLPSIHIAFDADSLP